jgi:hypothetical protein
MTRTITASVLTELAKSNIRPAIFIEMAFSGGTVRIWSGIGDKTWDSKTWSGVGYFLGMTPISETTELRAEGVQISLSGIPSSLLSTALNDNYQGRACNIWLGFLNDDKTIIADPVKVLTGRMDDMKIDEGPETSKITLSVENILIDLNRKDTKRSNHESQQLDYPGDLAYEFQTANVDKKITWGR